MDVEAHVENEDQFWEELDDLLSTPCDSHETIDDTLRLWLSVATEHKEKYLHTRDDVAHCSFKLLNSSLVITHKDYVRNQIIFGLLQEDDLFTLHLAAAFLLLDGRDHEATFESMNKEGAFSKLVHFIRDRTDDGLGLHRLFLELLYEMSRIQRLSQDDLRSVDGNIILYFFQVIESLSNDVDDPYHYPIIRVLLVLNEQYMVSAYSPNEDAPAGELITNHIVKTLSTHGGVYKTFGENIILLLNRESETSLQLLILKLLYLLFTTTSTREYFYTNDLHVLVDILIRNLFDLPDDGESPSSAPLRHTYLRVLHPLLAHTQLRNPPHYKRDQLRKLLWVLGNTNTSGHSHFAEADETTVRLVGRCMLVEWLKESDDYTHHLSSRPTLNTLQGGAQSESVTSEERATTPIGILRSSEATTTRRTPPAAPPPRRSQTQAAIAKRKLGMGLHEAQESTTSIAEISSHRERPVVMTPSRSTSGQIGRLPLSADQRDVMEADHGLLLRPAAVVKVELGLADEVPERSPFIGDDDDE